MTGVSGAWWPGGGWAAEMRARRAGPRMWWWWWWAWPDLSRCPGSPCAARPPNIPSFCDNASVAAGGGRADGG